MTVAHMHLFCDDVQNHLGRLMEEHRKLDDEVDEMNKAPRLSQPDHDRLREIKRVRLRVRDKIEALPLKMQI